MANSANLYISIFTISVNKGETDINNYFEAIAFM